LLLYTCKYLDIVNYLYILLIWGFVMSRAKWNEI
jgi:hypothetical protein